LTPAPRVELVGVRLDVSGDLGQQRRRQHLPSTVPDDLVQQRATTRAGLSWNRHIMDYLEHGRTFPNQRANAGP
jgi:hypothetical protein